MDFVNSFKSFVLLTIFLVLFSNGINGVIDPTLPVPINVINETPNQRTFATISWNAPPNYFYPFYNLYYRRVDDPVFRVVPSIQGNYYVLSFENNPYITPGTSFIFQVSGLLADGRESNPVQVDPTKSVLLPNDPKRDATKGISGTSCVVNVRNNVYCTWTAGSVPVTRVNFRVKCIKPNGDNRIIRKFVFGTARNFIEIYNTPRNSVCKILVHPLYAAAFRPKYNNVYGHKLKFTVTTPIQLPNFS